MAREPAAAGAERRSRDGCSIPGLGKSHRAEQGHNSSHGT